MSKKQPALITRYKTAIADLAAAQENIKRLQDGEKKAESSLKYSTERAQKAESEIEQVHTLLDVLPNTPPRKAEDGYTQNAVMTRLAGYLAHR